MASLTEQLGSVDLGQIPALLQTSLTTLASAQPTITVNGETVPLDFSALSGLGPLIEAAQQLPSNPQALEQAVRDMLRELQSITTIPELQLAAEVLVNLERIGSMVAEVVERAGGDPAELVEQLLGEAGGLSQIVNDLVGRFMDAMPTAQLPEAVRVPVEALSVVASGQAVNATQLADVVARFLIGVDLQALNAPSITISGSIGAVAGIGGDLTAITARFADLTTRVRGVIPMLQAAQPDVPAILTTLSAIRAGIDALFGELPALVGRLAGSLEEFDAAGFTARITAALQPLLALVPNISVDLRTSTLEPLRALRLQVEALDAAAIDALFADVETRFRAALAATGIGEVLDLIAHYRELAVDRIRRINLGRFRDEIVRALSSIEARINAFAFDAPRELATRLETVRALIAGIDTTRIRGAVQAVKAKLEELIANFPIADLSAQVDGAIDNVASLANQLVTALEDIERRLDEVAAQVDAIDFEAAADETRNLMVDIRETVQEAVGSDDIPAAARSALSLAAGGLRQINLQAEVKTPIFTQLDALDPNVLLTPLQLLEEQLHALLDRVTPSALVAQLDQPFLEAIAVIEQYKPSALIGTLSREFDRLAELLDHADPRTLVAPLQGEFERITAAIREAANPDPIFQPLETVYAQIIAGVDAVDLEKLLGGIVRKVADMPKSIGDSVQTAVDARTGGANVALPGAPANFRFGDLVRPFALIVQDVRRFVNGLPQDVIGGALAAIAAPVVFARELADPEHGFLGRMAAEIDARASLLLPDRGSGPAAELMLALQDLEVTLAARADLSASVHTQLGGGVASVQLDARLTLLAEARIGLDESVARFFERVSPPELRIELRRVADALNDLVPPQLTGLAAAATVQQRIDALFDAIDPAAFIVELDAIGDAITAKFASLRQELVNGIVRIITVLFDTFEAVMPAGMIVTLREFMSAIRAELAVLDPAPIKQEMRDLIDSVINVVNAFSPAAIAAQLGVLFDAVKAKVQELDPEALVGSTTELDAPFEALRALQPSVVLEPLVTKAQQLEEALADLLDLELGEALVRAVVRLRAAIELALDDVFAEFDALLAFLEGSGGSSVSGSASISI